MYFFIKFIFSSFAFMKEKIIKRGRKPLPVKERKVRIYILVKQKNANKGQKLIDKIAFDLNQ